MVPAGDDAPRLGLEQIDEQLVEAIQDGRLRHAVRALEAATPRLDHAARARLAEAAEALAAIDAMVHLERRRLLDVIRTAGIDVRSASGPGDDRPLHLVFLDVAPADVLRASIALEHAGYCRLGPRGPAAWRAARAVQGSCVFRAADGNPFRVELRWSTRPLSARGPIGRLLTPHPSDLEAISLPLPLWPAYLPVHLLRLPLRRLRRRREPPNLGPFLETPAALIEPLLRFADLSSDDVLVDLGSGDGRLVITAARIFGCRARGLEADPALVARARAQVEDAGLVDHVDITCGDLSEAGLDDAGVVVAFLPVETVERLLPALLDRLRPGARFVAHEQQRLRAPRADARLPLLSKWGISVAHRWNR
jgi:hypothetical protein